MMLKRQNSYQVHLLTNKTRRTFRNRRLSSALEWRSKDHRPPKLLFTFQVLDNIQLEPWSAPRPSERRCRKSCVLSLSSRAPQTFQAQALTKISIRLRRISSHSGESAHQPETTNLRFREEHVTFHHLIHIIQISTRRRRPRPIGSLAQARGAR